MKPHVLLGFCAGAMLLTTGDAGAHHSFDGEFDGSQALRLRGVVTRIELRNPHSAIHLEVHDGDARSTSWALESPSLFILRRRGLEHAVKVGDTLSVCGYAARRDSPRAATDPALGAQRRLSTAVLTPPHGEPLLWENYRQGKCGLDR